MPKEELYKKVMREFNLNEKEAKSLILSGRIFVGDKIVTKCGVKIKDEEKVKIKEKERYVSRGAYKLLDALDSFNIEVKNKICMDVGSSTGGFTQVLLERGAKKVIAIDSGKNQLDYRLRIDERVILFENTKITNFKKEFINEKIDMAVMDVSFTSSIRIIKYLFEELGVRNLIVLIKPQFEYNRLKKILMLPEGFNGIIKDENLRNKIINYIEKEINLLNIKILNKKECIISGCKGNKEYLFYLGK